MPKFMKLLRWYLLRGLTGLLPHCCQLVLLPWPFSSPCARRLPAIRDDPEVVLIYAGLTLGYDEDVILVRDDPVILVREYAGIV